jgi:uncharacterized protein (TIGR02246 family)
MQPKSITGFVGPALMLWLVFQFATTPTVLYAQVSEQPVVAKLVQDWHTALTNGDLDAALAQYADDAVFFPTFVNAARSSTERRAFLQTLIDKKPIAVLNPDQRVRLFGNAATSSGSWLFTVNNAEGVRVQMPVRYLFVYEKRGGRWLIVEQHVSAMPEKKAV